MYVDIEPHKILNDLGFKMDDFFKDVTNNMELNLNYVFDDKVARIFKDTNIKMANIKIKIIPFRVSLPLNKSLSVFEVEEKKNKRYKALFGTEEEYLEVGYIDTKVYNKLFLKERKYWRFVGANMNINTIFPDLSQDNMEINMDELMKKGFGEFDFSSIK